MDNPGENARWQNEKKAKGNGATLVPLRLAYLEEITAWQAQRAAWSLRDHPEHLPPAS